MVKLFNGNNIDILKTFEDNSIDSIVTDPPYGLSFMGKKWDYDVPSVELWKECLRVLKPGGHILAACGTRTQHRMAVNSEDAGFEVRDLISYLYSTNNVFQELYNSLNQDQQKLMQMVFGNDSILLWVYGSGFPKSLNIGKSIDKMLGNERENLGNGNLHSYKSKNSNSVTLRNKNYEEINIITKGNTEFEGWGTALKPAMELWTLARKPISETNIAQNVLRWRTGGINIDECRIGTEDNTGRKQGNFCFDAITNKTNYYSSTNPLGRFPANVILDGSEEVVAGFPETGISKGGNNRAIQNICYNNYGKNYNNKANNDGCGFGDSGSASRFFYTAKAHSSERNYGLEGFEEKRSSNYGNNGFSSANPTYAVASNHHPTVKPLDLMQYLVRLITPKGGVCMDCFMGSGTTGMACKLEKFDFIGIELEKEYFDIAKARIDAVGEVTEIKLTNGRLF